MRPARAVVTGVVLLFAVSACPFSGPGSASGSPRTLGRLPGGEKILYEHDSAYNHIVVTEDEQGIRCLLFERDGALQSVVKVEDPDYLELPYVRAMLVGLAFCEPAGTIPERVLMVGLGGGTIPRFMRRHFPEMTIHVVEIDPEVVSVAKRFFGFQEDKRLKVFVQDGRKFIENCKKPYDMILLDAYSSENIPYHLATEEFLKAARKAVTPNGIVVANVWSRFSNPLYDSMVCTYQAVFEDLYIFDVEDSGNKIFAALKRPAVLRKELLVGRAERISQERQFPYDLGQVVKYGYRRATGRYFPGEVLKDRREKTQTGGKKAAGAAG